VSFKLIGIKKKLLNPISMKEKSHHIDYRQKRGSDYVISLFCYCVKEGTSVLKQLVESLALQNANSFHCELSRNQRPLPRPGLPWPDRSQRGEVFPLGNGILMGDPIFSTNHQWESWSEIDV
jgi:hypothetical protein